VIESPRCRFVFIADDDDDSEEREISLSHSIFTSLFTQRGKKRCEMNGE